MRSRSDRGEQVVRTATGVDRSISASASADNGGVPSSPLVFSLSESMVHAVSRLVDDWQNPRDPTHSDIGATLTRAGLAHADPHADPTAQKMGKQKRVRQALQWALDSDVAAGTRGVEALINLVRGSGGFLPSSPNYCGEDAIRTCVAAFESEPVELTVDGVLRPRNLSALSGRELSDALRSYIVRAQRGHEDSVLLTGTGNPRGQPRSDRGAELPNDGVTCRR
jgi:hypothetical protein